MSRKNRIENCIRSNLETVQLVIEDESFMHHVPKNAESHFKITIVTQSFTGLSRIERHRLINNLLQAELDSGLHALSLHLYSPQEWQKHPSPVPDSPKCLGGKHRESKD